MTIYETVRQNYIEIREMYWDDESIPYYIKHVLELMMDNVEAFAAKVDELTPRVASLEEALAAKVDESHHLNTSLSEPLTGVEV